MRGTSTLDTASGIHCTPAGTRPAVSRQIRPAGTSPSATSGSRGWQACRADGSASMMVARGRSRRSFAATASPAAPPPTTRIFASVSRPGLSFRQPVDAKDRAPAAEAVRRKARREMEEGADMSDGTDWLRRVYHFLL